MAVYTEVTDEALTAFLADFDIGSVVAFRGIAEGVENSNYSLRTTSGDFILTLPAIAALRGQFPKAHLEVLGYPHIVQLALAAGLVDRYLEIKDRGVL